METAGTILFNYKKKTLMIMKVYLSSTVRISKRHRRKDFPLQQTEKALWTKIVNVNISSTATSIMVLAPSRKGKRK